MGAISELADYLQTPEGHPKLSPPQGLVPDVRELAKGV
jgi:hypothetical protein